MKRWPPRKRTGARYTYNPVPLDRLDPPVGARQGILKAGDAVTIIRLSGCPKPGTMGHYHIAEPGPKGRFLGLVHGNSLDAREGAK